MSIVAHRMNADSESNNGTTAFCTARESLPSLSSSSSLSYSRNDLLSLNALRINPTSPARLKSFSDVLRRESFDSRARVESMQWGVDEGSSSTLNGEPVSKALPIPNPLHFNFHQHAEEGKEKDKDVLFDYQTLPPDRAAPVAIDFTNPEPFGGIQIKHDETQTEAQTSRKASTVFQSYPISARASSSTFGPNNGIGLAISLGEKYTSLRQHRSSSPSSSASIGSVSSFTSRSRSRSRSSSINLNPFAAPFPLPANTPESNPLSVDIPSLPLPKVLPSSLPAKPAGPLPPVFVKRESAALPQPMALPDIAPLGKDWEGESGVSGNERRRRASEIGAGMGSCERPERLVRLGERLRESMATQGRTVKIASV